MARSTSAPVLRGRVVEEELELTMVELCRVCHVRAEEVELWVVEGVVRPSGQTPADWRFPGSALARMRIAAHLARELELNAPGIALALDLLDRIARLEARLQLAGVTIAEDKS